MTLSAFLQKEKIEVFALLEFSHCRVTNESLFSRLFGEESPRAVLVCLLPYRTDAKKTPLSRYAHARDYHWYVRELCARAKESVSNVLSVCADHSPIDERHAALVAGLGVRGENGLLIHETYGSFCFIAEFFLSQVPPDLPLVSPQGIRECLRCGACAEACPTGALVGEGACLSALSQKKKLSEEEGALLKKHGILWGCDVCQEVCPLNREAAETPIPFFRERLISSLSEQTLSELLESGEFEKRAYAWRGEATIRRNLCFFEEE